MKKIILILIFLISTASFSQIEKSCEISLDSITMQNVYLMPSEKSTPVGGSVILHKKIREVLELDTSFCAGDPNKMLVEFIVCENGEVIGERIINTIITGDSKNELLKLITETKWNPGLCKNESVATLMRIPIVIDIRE